MTEKEQKEVLRIVQEGMMQGWRNAYLFEGEVRTKEDMNSGAQDFAKTNTPWVLHHLDRVSRGLCAGFRLIWEE